VPVMRSQPVAARSVAERLVEVAEGPPAPERIEIAGPEVHEMVDLVRALVRRRGERVAVIPLPIPGEAGRAMRSGALLPDPATPGIGPTFGQWLATQ